MREISIMKKNKPLKILQISPYYFPSIGGVSGVAQYISEELVKRGHEVTVFTANRDHADRPKVKYPSLDEINGVQIKRFTSIFNIQHMSFCAGQIVDLLKYKFDIIHSHAYRHPHNELASIAGKLKSTPVILHGHCPFHSKKSTSFGKEKIYSMYDRTLGKTMLKRIQKIFALTEYEKKKYQEMGAPCGKISIIPNAASDECFKPINIAPFVEKHNLAGRPIILFLGILNSWKRPDILIRMLPEIIKTIPQVMVLFVGPDAGMMDHIEKIATQLKVENNYKWIGPLHGEEKQQAFHAAELLMLPSDDDSFPLVLLEAMAHGKPVIGSDAVGPSVIIQNHKTGFILPRGDIDKFAGAALQLLTNPSLLMTMGNDARATALAQYSVSSIVGKIEATYYELLEQQALTV
jgi:glycosyltransferase involved in cell wall biosynthesis